MQKKQLNKKNIKEFSATLKEAGIKNTVLEIFFDVITNLIDPHEININENLQKVMDECKFESLDDINAFLYKYNDFTNSAIDLINSMSGVLDVDKFDKKIQIIFEALCDESQKRDSYEILHTKIDQILVKTIDVYEIDLMSNFNSSEEFMEHVENIFENEEVALQIVLLVSISAMMKDEEVDKSELRHNFLLVVSLVSILNEYRKEEFQRMQDDKSFTPRFAQEKIDKKLQSGTIKAGRNDPCPCGSGKKYKKCCLNKKIEKKIDPLSELDLPLPSHLPLSRNEIDAFYTLWSKVINFANKLLCEIKGEKYKKLYFKDAEEKYTLTQEAFEDNLYVNVRSFLLSNFDRIIDELISTSRVNKKNLEILKEWKRYRLQSDNFLIYESTSVGAIIWDVKSRELYHLYDLYDRVYNLSKKDTMLSMLLLPYKGRIIFDGVIGQMGVDFGQNMREMFLKDYVALRRDKSVSGSLPKQSSTTKIYQLKISIKGAKPPIWRRVLVEDDMTYKSLHMIIQDIFNWYDGHLHEFEAYGRRFTDLSFEFDYEFLGEDESKFTIADDLREIGDKMTYLYDFGDSWEHEIKLEDIQEQKEDENYPRCIKGKGRGPLEDIGGIWAYNQIVQAYKENDKETLEEFYIEDGFDPFEFDLDEINFRLR